MAIRIKKDIVKNYMFIEGLNNTHLASKIGVSGSYLNLILNGKRVASPRIAKSMADVLRVRVEDLFNIDFKN